VQVFINLSFFSSKFRVVGTNIWIPIATDLCFANLSYYLKTVGYILSICFGQVKQNWQNWPVLIHKELLERLIKGNVLSVYSTHPKTKN